MVATRHFVVVDSLILFERLFLDQASTSRSQYVRYSDLFEDQRVDGLRLSKMFEQAKDTKETLQSLKDTLKDIEHRVLRDVDSKGIQSCSNVRHPECALDLTKYIMTYAYSFAYLVIYVTQWFLCCAELNHTQELGMMKLGPRAVNVLDVFDVGLSFLQMT